MNDKERKRLKRKRKLAERHRRGRVEEITLELRPDAWAEEQLAQLFATSDRVERLPDGSDQSTFVSGEVRTEREAEDGSDYTDQMNAVVSAIERLPGTKIVTLISTTSLQPHMKIDVSAEGQWGYHLGHYSLFAAKLGSALHGGGSLLVRQFLEDKIAVAHKTEPRIMLIPKKRLYGVALGHGQVICTPADVLEVFCNTDATTGEPIPAEEGVEYGVLEL